MVNGFEINYGTMSRSIFFLLKKKEVLVHLGLKCLHLSVHLSAAYCMPVQMDVWMCLCIDCGRKAFLLLLIFGVSKQ